jgi:OOP family OmpA-OmpF porin
MRALLLAALLAGAAAASASGQTDTEAAPALPDPGAPEGAVPTAGSDRPYNRYALPVGRYTPAGPQAREVEGRVVFSGFRLDNPGVSTAEVMAGYRARLVELGFAPVFDCVTAQCGGFDFRFGVELLPAPSMLIDTADFAQLSTEKTDSTGAESVVSVLVSRLLGAVYIQTVVVVPGDPALALTAAPRVPVAAESGSAPAVLAQDEKRLLDWLAEFGHVPVQGLVFETGGATLSEGSTPAIELLSRLLLNNPALNVVIVGHSDNEGALDANIALSRRRAEAVRSALIEHGVAAERLDAHGVGYLAPVVSNATEEGRLRNRRVELVVR